MGVTRRAVAETGRVVVGQPAVVATVLAVGVLAPLLAVLAGLIPVVGGVVYALFVHPFLLAGLLHVSSAAVDGPVGVGTFLAGIRDHALALVWTFFLAGVVFLLVGWVATVVVFAVGFTGAVELTVGIAVVLVLFAVMGVGLQFVDASVVVDGDGATGAVEHSWEALAHHPVSVLGYTAVRVLSLGLLAGAAGTYLRGGELFLGGSGSPPGTLALVAALGIGFVGYLGGGVFHAVFYRKVSA